MLNSHRSWRMDGIRTVGLRTRYMLANVAMGPAGKTFPTYCNFQSTWSHLNCHGSHTKRQVRIPPTGPVRRLQTTLDLPLRLQPWRLPAT